VQGGDFADGDSGSSASKKDLLEKKWTSVVKLKKQCLQLEQDKSQLEKQVKELIRGNMGQGTQERTGVRDLIPYAPQKAHLQGHRGKISKVAIHPVYPQVASCGEDASIRLWDLESGDHEQTLKGHTGIINYIAFSPNAPVLASCSTDMTIKLWNLQNFINYKTLQGHDHEVSAVEFLPNGDYIVSCSRDMSIKLWDLATSICLHTVKGHSDWVRHLSVNGSGSLVASCSRDQTIMIWNVEKIKAKSQDPVV